MFQIKVVHFKQLNILHHIPVLCTADIVPRLLLYSFPFTHSSSPSGHSPFALFLSFLSYSVQYKSIFLLC